MNIVAWGNVAPWAERRQVEQDLVISRTLVELFNDDFLKEELLFRGGTALNKLHFPEPFRYSEDIFQRYMAAQELGLSRAQAEQRMFAKLADPGLVADIRPLLAVPEAERLTDKAINGAFARVFTDLIGRLPGRRWARTNEMIEHFGLMLARTD